MKHKIGNRYSFVSRMMEQFIQ